jgi:hypothetical protein
MKDSYSEYFEIDPNYFSCVNDHSIKAGLDWKKCYPHKTFVDILQVLEKVLARNIKKSIWIEGAYGTGKSYAAFALKNMLDCNENELSEYFNKYAVLDKDLKNKLIGHKKEQIVVAYKFASSEINCDNHLILAVQKTISKTLKEKNITYKGEHTLQEKIIEWLEVPEQKELMNAYLGKNEYKALFNNMTTDDIINKLRSRGENTDLLDKILKLGDDRGITAFKMDMDDLVVWLTDIIDKNNLRALVFIWDEFSDYFKNNRTKSFSGFQKLVELSNVKPFYFMIVTHQSSSYFPEQGKEGKLILDRFERIEITMPDDIAFDLIASALEIKKSKENDWEQISDTLNARLHDSKSEVEKLAGIERDKTSKLMPLHPMAALLLKHISSTYKSNQRSMFEFIKNQDSIDSESFQWFIGKFGPYSEEPLLTIDKLWKFFYEKGKNDLEDDIRSILNTFNREENKLNGEEKRVLKAILMMQAIYLKNQVELFETTERNISIAFNGTLLNNKAGNIAQKLSRERIIFERKMPNGKTVFQTVEIVNNSEEINRKKEELKRNFKTNSLIDKGNLKDALNLIPALNLRFEFVPIYIENFANKTNEIKSKFSKTFEWKIPVMVSFSKDELECIELKKRIKEMVKNEDCKNIVFINANTYMKPEIMDKYLEDLANSDFYSGKDNSLSKDFERKAMEILKNFRNDITNGEWQICSFEKQNEEPTNYQNIQSFLLAFVMGKYPYPFDSINASEAMFGSNGLRPAAECGIIESTKGIMTKAEEKLKEILKTAWKNENYWQKESESPISRVKIALDEQIQNAFKNDGRISILDIYRKCLYDFGYMPCNISAFLLGFLLKEYTKGNYRYSDDAISEPLDDERLKEIIGEAISEENNPNGKYKQKFIVCITEEEKECFRMFSKVFDIPEKNLNSVESATNLVRNKLKELAFPIWTLKEIYPEETQFIDKIADFVNTKQEGNSAKIAKEIGSMIKKEPEAIEVLTKLITNENTKKGMEEFLEKPENKNLQQIAKEVNKDVLSDAHNIFKDSLESNWLWDKETGKEQIKNLEEKYKKDKENLLNSKEKEDAMRKIDTMDSDSLKKCIKNMMEKYPYITKAIVEDIL